MINGPTLSLPPEGQQEGGARGVNAVSACVSGGGGTGEAGGGEWGLKKINGEQTLLTPYCCY